MSEFGFFFEGGFTDCLRMGLGFEMRVSVLKREGVR